MALLAAACGSRTETAQTTGSSSTSESATVAALSFLRARPVAQWGDVPISTVCVRVDQTYPQAPDLRFPIETWVGQLLGPVGISVVAPDAACDATFSVTVSIEVLSAEYGHGSTTYFTGHHRYVDIALEAPDREAITTSFPHEVEPGDWATNLDETTPEGALEEQAQYVAKNVLDFSMQIWGPTVAVEALCLPFTDYPAPNFRFIADQLLIDAAGIRDTYTTAPSPNDYESWRHWVETGERVDGANKIEGPARQP
jgi:hypothetical protein